MELVKKKAWWRTFSFSWNKIDIILLPILACGFVLMEDAFLFNPFILLILFLAYQRSGVAYFTTFLTMVSVASIVNIAYGLELFLTSLVYFYLSFGFQKISFKGKNQRYYPLVVINILLMIPMLIKSPTINSFFYCLTSAFVSLLFAKQLFEFFESYEDESKNMSLFSLSFFGLALYFSSMFWPVLGFIMIRVIALSLTPNKKMSAIIFLLIALVSTVYVYHYSFAIALMVIGPCLITLCFKNKYLAFGIAHLLVSIALDPLFYTNGVFYQGLVALIIVIMLSKVKIEAWNNLLERDETQTKILFFEQEKRHQEQIQGMIDYINALDFELGQENISPEQKARQRVYREACAECDHLEYCPLVENLKDYVHYRLKTEQKKQISKDCIKPYKLTLSLQQAHAIYLTEDGYYIEAMKRKSVLASLMNKIRIPLLEMRDDYHGVMSVKQQIVNKAEKEDINIQDIACFGDKIKIIIKDKHIDEDSLIAILNQCLNTNMYLEKKTFSWIHQNVEMIFTPLKEHLATYSVYTKPAKEDASGDFYIVDQNQSKMTILLCDGMGHDEHAKRTSQSLAHSFMTLYHQKREVISCLNDINSLFRISSSDDNYSTFDLCEIQLQTLECRFFKGGSAASFIIHDNQFLAVPVGGLPIGLLDEIDVETKTIALQKGDVIIMVSDGIGDFMESQDPQIFKDILDYDNFFRHLFQIAVENMQHIDDATMIICRIL